MTVAVASPPQLISKAWVITKASIGPDNQMRWKATTSKFSRDIQGDLVTRSFYQEAIRRIKSKTVPLPFFSVAHYGEAPICLKCGFEYKALTSYICPDCSEPRLLAGIATDVFIDGDQPKAKGLYYPTPLGLDVYHAVRKDIEDNAPDDERVRISMGFFPDPIGGTVHKSESTRDFIAGWVQHFAGTRVPVVAETPIGLEGIEKSMTAIITKLDDARSIVTEDKAQLLDDLDRKLRTKSGVQLITKAQRKCPGCGALVPPDDVDCPECGKLVGKAIMGMEEDTVDEDDLPVKDEPEEEDNPEEEKKEKELTRVDADVSSTYSKSAIDEEFFDMELIQQAREALQTIDKALAVPGSDKTELLAQAANLVSAIRDYAHTVADTPNTTGAPAETQAAVGQLNPTPQPGQNVGNPATVVPEENVQERPHATDEQVAETEVEEGDNAQKTEDDVAEEGRLHFIKQVTEDDKKNAEQPPMPVSIASKKKPKATPQVKSVVEGIDELANLFSRNLLQDANMSFEKRAHLGKAVAELNVLKSEGLSNDKIAQRLSDIVDGVAAVLEQAIEVPQEIKSAVKPKTKTVNSNHPIAVYIQRWGQELMEALTGVSGGRQERYEAVQKSLNTFAPAMVQLINQAVPVSEHDMAAIMEAAVKSAVAQTAERYQNDVEDSKRQIEDLRRQVEEMTKAVVSGEVKSLTRRSPMRRSLDAVRPVIIKSEASDSVEGVTVPVLNGDQVQIKKFSAKEVAQATVTASPLIRY